MRALLVFALIAALSGCSLGRDSARSPLPSTQSAVVPKLQIIERRVYVKVPANLTKRSAVPEGSLPQCFEVAAQRRQVIEEQNARFEKIESIQGTEVAP